MIRWEVSMWIAGHGKIEYHFSNKEAALDCYNKYASYTKEIEEGFLCNLRIRPYWVN